MKKIGVLALQGGVEEHVAALLSASEKLNLPVQVVEVRTPEDLGELDGIILPGGESTSLSLLMQRAGIFQQVSQVRKIMGTCAGAILLAKNVRGEKQGQKFLSLMDITIDRNAYGSQLHSFESPLTTVFGTLNGVFIRAPRMTVESKDVQPMAFHGQDAVAAYQPRGNRHFIATTFHPELTSTRFHEFFIKL